MRPNQAGRAGQARPYNSLPTSISPMFHIEDVLQLKETEKVKLFVRRHPMTLLPSLLTATLLIVTPFFFIFPLFSFRMPGVAVFLSSVLIGIVIALRAFLLWDSDALIVTTDRLVKVDQKGVFSRFVTELAMDSISDVAWKRQGVVDTLFSVGSLSVNSPAVSKTIEMKRMSHPQRLHETINDLRRAITQNKPQTKVENETRERIQWLMAEMEKLPKETLEKVERMLRDTSSQQAEPSGLVVQKKIIE